MGKLSLLDRMFREKLKDYKLIGDVKSSGLSACYTIESIKGKKKYFMRVLPCLSTLNAKAYISHNDSVVYYPKTKYNVRVVETLQYFTYLVTITDFFDESLESLVIKNRKTWKLFPERDIKRWLFQILTALRPHHKRSKYHGAISLSTVLISRSNNSAYLDYNFSANIGKNGFKAPELYDAIEYSSASDVWAVGVILYQLITLTPPFSTVEDLYSYIFNPNVLLINDNEDNNNNNVNNNNNNNRGNNNNNNSKYSNELIEIIRLCLTPHPMERVSVDQLLESSYMQDQYLHDFAGIPEVDDIIERQAWESCNELRISLEHALGGDGIFGIARVIPQFPFLRVFAIENRKKKTLLDKMGIELKKTEVLEVGAQNASVLAQMIESCPSITELRLNNIGLGNEGVKIICTSVLKMKQINIFCIDHNNAYENTIQTFASLLKQDREWSQLYL